MNHFELTVSDLYVSYTWNVHEGKWLRYVSWQVWHQREVVMGKSAMTTGLA